MTREPKRRVTELPDNATAVGREGLSPTVVHVSGFEQTVHPVSATKNQCSVEVWRATDMITERTRIGSQTYSGGFGKSVVLLIAIRQRQVSLLPGCGTLCSGNPRP